jgi:hypothetical protein
MPESYRRLEWDSNTFSWKVFSPESTREKIIWTSRGLSYDENSKIYLDVPFGHVVSFTTDVMDILDNKLSKFFITKFASLGPVGRNYSNLMVFT